MENKIVLIKGDKAISSTEQQLYSADREQLNKELSDSIMTPEEVRKKLLSEQVNSDVTLHPFEVKQHFISRGDYGNARKTDRLDTGNPSQTVRKIKAELSFFGAAFLEGFLDFYGIKRNEALRKYENRLIIISEQQFDTGERREAVCQVKRGIPQKIMDFKSRKEAEAIIQSMQEEQKQEKILTGGLKHEINKKSE